MRVKSISELVGKKPLYGWLLFGGTLGITFVIGLFASSIMERRSESRVLFQVGTPVAELEADSAKWGRNFPREYERWKQTADSSFRSKHGGSAPRDLLAEQPKLVVLWAGYAFSRQYDQARGHAHTLDDIRATLRTAVPQPGTCWTCKSSNVPGLMKQMGVAQFYKTPWAQLNPSLHQPIGCVDCHNSATMDLEPKRPALHEAYQRQGRDLKLAGHQERRSLVCAQCHVEYYFKGKEEKYLTFPWDRGSSVEAIERYYDEAGFTDWTHALSRAPMLKAQHPDWELFQTSIHYKRGLSCADCHMPYRSEGGVKFTDHKIQSPLANIRGACGVCHPVNEEELRRNVEERQDAIVALKRDAEDTLARAHIEAKAAWDRGATEPEMAKALQLIRHAQWRYDFIAASIGSAFHAPLESARVLSGAIQRAVEARLELARVLIAHGLRGEVTLPDLSTKAKAQGYIGLDMKKLEAEKAAWLK